MPIFKFSPRPWIMSENGRTVRLDVIESASMVPLANKARQPAAPAPPEAVGPGRLDPDACYEILKARDARYDGLFYVGVSTTRVYCRPICAVRLPGRDRCSFFPAAAMAEAAGYRPCMRCRPELAPGAAPVDAVGRLAAQAAARIEAGALDEGTLDELADEFGVSPRQLRRVILTEFGVAPLALARTRRLLLAKQLLTDTPLRVIDVAFASGFSSLRQFNRQFQERYRMRPTALRKRRPAGSERGVVLKLGYRAPFAWNELAGFLAQRGDARVEGFADGRYRRAVRLGDFSGWFVAAPAAGRDCLDVEIAPTLVPVLAELTARLRRLFDLGAHPPVIDSLLGQDPRLGGARPPGLRVPGAFDGFELALRAVLGQQISVRAATTIFGRCVATFGATVATPFPGIDRVPPRAEDIANARVPALRRLGLTERRAETVLALARAVATGDVRLGPGADPVRARGALLAIPGIGPWTVEYIAMRALGDPDAFPASDLGLLRAFGLTRPAELQARAEAWRPWRAYAAIQLWTVGAGGG